MGLLRRLELKRAARRAVEQEWSTKNILINSEESAALPSTASSEAAEAVSILSRKKVLTVIIAVVVALAAAGIAWAIMMFTSNTLTNTFSAGKIDGIVVAESVVDEYGVKTGGTTDVGNAYTLVPKTSYVKDPTITVPAKTEACWLYVCVDDQIAAIEDSSTIAEQLTTNGWTAIDKKAFAGDGVIYAHAAIDKADTEQTFKVFESFTIKSDADVSLYQDKQINVTPYAVQKSGFDTAQAAWDASFGA